MNVPPTPPLRFAELASWSLRRLAVRLSEDKSPYQGIPAAAAGQKKFNSRPLAPIVFREKPFGEYVEGLSYVSGKSCGFMIVFKWSGAVNELRG